MLKTIEVTQEIIDEAVDLTIERRQASSHCALAVALHRQGYPDAVVGMTVWYPSGGTKVYVDMSQEMRDFVHLFDMNYRDNPQRITPITLQVEIPDDL